MAEANLNGLWLAQFYAGTGAAGSGVVVINGESLLGGDGGYFYRGRVWMEGDRAVAEFEVAQWKPGTESILGQVGRFPLRLSGKFAPQQFEIGGHLAGNPRTPEVVVRLTRPAE